MLDILNTIDWESVTFRKSNPTRIPDLIRQFHNATSHEEFESYFKEFTELVHGLGIVGVATAPSARVLIQLLKHTDDTKRKIMYCRRLMYFISSTQFTYRYLPLHRHRNLKLTSINHLRSELEVYDAVAEGFDMFMALLNDDNLYLCVLSMNILALLPHKFEMFIPALLDCIDNSSDEWVQAIGAWTFTEIVDYNTRHLMSKEEAEGKLSFWAEYGDSLLFRTTAAYGRLLKQSTLENATHLPNSVIDIIAQSLSKNVLSDISSLPNDEIKRLFEWSLPFNNHAIRRVIFRTNRFWIPILQKSQLKPVDAHIYYRELLSCVFMQQDYRESTSLWDNYTHIDENKINDSLIYRRCRTNGKYDPNKVLIERRIVVLQAIVDCDPFWEIPTNIFSFYHGLPDEREALRELVQQSQ